ncbi:MAG: hypothetical protein F4Z85_05360 [Gemmatimonadetes bacterium]|nr:hypothetical protein [Gemmatimonadota bacterium]MYB71229.1 hypothetical protein [Gemmatimonadota bacterium]
MNRDPIVEEIHQTRQKIWEECGGDLDRFLNRLRGTKKQDRSRVVSTTSLPAEAYVKKSTEVVVRGLVGAIPYVGTLLNEAIFEGRARLKQERLEKFVEYLAENLQNLESDKINVAYIQSAEFADFLEDVLVRAAKVRAEEKRRKLAAVLAGRLQHAEGTPFDDRFLDLLITLSDIQVRILAEHLRAAEKRENSDSEEDAKHRQPSYYNVPESEYPLLIQDLMSRGLFVFAGGLGEVTELGRAFIYFLENDDRAL